VSRPELSAEDILAALNQHGVEYVIIGAFAAIAQGAPIERRTTSTSRPGETKRTWGDSPRRLEELGAGIRVNDLDDGLPFAHDAASLSQMSMLNLTCAAGDFDLVFAPVAAPAGYEDLVGDSVLIEVGGKWTFERWSPCAGSSATVGSDRTTPRAAARR